MAYDAWCLSQYGTDRYLNSYPLYLINFGGGQSALYAYLTAFLFHFFGFKMIFLRLPSILFSLLTVIFGMLIIRHIFPNRKELPILGGYLITISPIFILMARIGMDCHLMLGASTVFLYFFIQAINSDKYLYYVLSGITGGIILYTYALSYIVLPLFLLLSFLYVLSIKKFSLRKWLSMGIPLGLIASPLIAIQFINLLDLPEMYLGPFTLTKLPGYRVDELGGFNFASFRNIIVTIFTGDMWSHNSISGIPNLYWIAIPFVVIGIIHCIFRLILSIRQKNLDPKVFCLIWFICIIYTMSHIWPCLTQLNSIFFVMIVFIIDAWSIIFPISNKLCDFVLKSALGIIYVTCFLSFAIYYYNGQYTIDNYPSGYFSILQTDAITFIDSNPSYGKKGVQTAVPTIVYALSSLKPPYELGISLESSFLENGYVHCSYLGSIEDGYYYIVDDAFPDYIVELKDKGFSEINYGHYSLFYKKQ